MSFKPISKHVPSIRLQKSHGGSKPGRLRMNWLEDFPHWLCLVQMFADERVQGGRRGHSAPMNYRPVLDSILRNDQVRADYALTLLGNKMDPRAPKPEKLGIDRNAPHAFAICRLLKLLMMRAYHSVFYDNQKMKGHDRATRSSEYVLDREGVRELIEYTMKIFEDVTHDETYNHFRKIV